MKRKRITIQDKSGKTQIHLNFQGQAKQRAAKFLRDVFPDEAGLVKAFREHARDAVARYKRSIGR